MKTKWLLTGLVTVLAMTFGASLLYALGSAHLAHHMTPSISVLHNWFAATADGAPALAIAAVAVPGAKLKELLGKLKAIQDEFAGKVMPPEKAKEFEDLAAETVPIQAEHDRAVKLRQIEETARSFHATLPPDNQPDAPAPEAKDAKDPSRVVGFLTLGDYVVAQKAYASFRAARFPAAQFRLAEVKHLFTPRGGQQILVGLTAEQVSEAKAVTTIGTGVIEPSRVPELIRVTEHDRLSLRDVLNISQTSSDAVKYTRMVSYTRGAAAVAHSATKPEASMVIDSVTQAVRKIAVWLPVEDEQVADMSQLAGLINNELLYDVGKHVEELVMYGSGIGEEFAGILTDPAVQNCRSEAGDTLIDIARRGVTDVRRAGFEPNAILADPLDWEDIVLAKGTDKRYVWVVVTDGATQRLWGVPVIETVACSDFQGDPTEARNLLVGDFKRGATLWDRQDAAVSVGWVNDQFIKNQRTLLAEFRGAFGVTRPGAFRKYETQAAVTS